VERCGTDGDLLDVRQSTGEANVPPYELRTSDNEEFAEYLDGVPAFAVQGRLVVAQGFTPGG
jgi:hypothetical protein